jgi:CheY-like chemotaxis protein
LIAEDNLINVKVLRRILEKLGIQNIEVVYNGQRAVEREADEAFDCVLMDIQVRTLKRAPLVGQ